jgi:hypothetical protein
MKWLAGFLLLPALSMAQIAPYPYRTDFVVLSEDTCYSGTNCGYTSAPNAPLAAAPNQTLLQTAMGYPWIDGLMIRTTWEDIENTKGTYDWSYLDSQIAAMASAGKKAAIDIDAGWATPAWVYTDGSASYTSADGWTLTAAHSDSQATSPNWCQNVKIPVPWDTTYLSDLGTFIAALGARYATNSTVVLVHVTGINTQTDETLLPRSKGNTVTCASCTTGNNGATSCVFPNDVAAWQTAGYTSTEMNTAFDAILGDFINAFPNQSLDLMTGNTAFPPIGSSGALNPDAASLPENTFAAYGQGQIGTRFIIQENNWTAYRVSPIFMAAGHSGVMGLQEQDPVSSYSGGVWSADPNCVMNYGVSPCSPIFVFSQAMANAFSYNTQYLELFTADVTNVALQPLLQGSK